MRYVVSPINGLSQVRHLFKLASVSFTSGANNSFHTRILGNSGREPEVESVLARSAAESR